LHLKIDVKVVYFKGRKDFTTIKKIEGYWQIFKILKKMNR
jgi:hypothetical protein